MRGYAAIGLDRPKDTANLGGVLRAAQVYGAAVVMLSGGRMGKYATDTMKAWRHIPCVSVADLWDSIPFAAQPVVVELCPRAKPIFDFVHPHSAFYIFGPEDGSVSKHHVERAPHVIYVPMEGCMNLAATVNVVLYDRLCKQQKVAA